MKYAFIALDRLQFSVRTMCRLLRVHPIGFYAWLKNPLSRRASEDRRQIDQPHQLRDLCRELRYLSREGITAELLFGDIVLMDNFSSHKGPRVRETSNALAQGLNICGPTARISTRNAFSKLKSLLRKVAERSTGGLWNTIGQLRTLFTPKDAAAMSPPRNIIGFRSKASGRPYVS